MANVYKTFTVEQMNNRSIAPLSSEDNLKLNVILTDFITYFKNKHL